MKRVLIVDDEPDNVDVLAIFLTRNGYSVEKAYDGKEGVRVAQALRPDLVLLDIMMHDMDGYEACTIIKQDPDLSGVPVIFLSAKAEAFDVERGKAVGAFHYITKPYSFKNLLRTVQGVLEGETHD